MHHQYLQLLNPTFLPHLQQNKSDESLSEIFFTIGLTRHIGDLKDLAMMSPEQRESYRCAHKLLDTYNHLQNKRDTNAPAPSPMLVSECEHHFMALD